LTVTKVRKRIVIIGGTSAIAEHCARLWAQESPVDLVLVGRDMGKTEIVASDLRVRSPHSIIESIQADFLDSIQIKSIVDKIMKVGAVDIVLIAHGFLPDQLQCQENLDLCHKALAINGISPVLFAEAFAGHMQRVNSGTLAIIGSVAGDKGRKSNYVYGSAKGLISRYTQGLEHRLSNTNVKVVLIKPGPTETPMTANFMHQRVSLASVVEVAQQIVLGVKLGKPVVYAPAKWRFIMMIVRHLPRLIFNKMNI